MVEHFLYKFGSSSNSRACILKTKTKTKDKQYSFEHRARHYAMLYFNSHVLMIFQVKWIDLQVFIVMPMPLYLFLAVRICHINHTTMKKKKYFALHSNLIYKINMRISEQHIHLYTLSIQYYLGVLPSVLREDFFVLFHLLLDSLIYLTYWSSCARV